MNKLALNAAFIFAAIAVILGAMGAHALKPILSEDMLASFETAVKYQIYHSFALFGTGIMSVYLNNKWIKRAIWAFIVGIILFSGSIYLLVYLKSTLTIGLGGLGLITPIGGVLFILGWLCLLIAVNKKS